MTLDVRLAFVFVAVMALFPYAILRGRARSIYAIVDGASYAALAALWFISPLLMATLPGPLAFSILVVLKLALFAVVLSTSPEGIGPNVAATFAAVVYMLVIPHVLQWPIDGDEPFYLLITESIVHDRDLDLRNQYEHLDRSVVRRSDLRPQWGDPVGPNGEQYSRHEPFLSILLIPGLLIGGLPGAVATIAFFGALFVRSFLLLLEEEGISARTRALVFPLIAFGPPVLYYATRIWPEVPAGLFLTEALRASRSGRRGWLAASLLGLSLLKLRFIPIAATLIALDFVRRRDRRMAVTVALLLVIPFVIVALISGSVFNVHGIGELLPGHPLKYLRGMFGLMLDGQAGLLFAAPLWFLGLFSLARWRELSSTVRLGWLSAIPYLVLLVPRDEWHGGWSPTLRYLVVFAPLFGFAAAHVIERARGLGLAFVGVGSAVLVAHGIAFPWRLFHIANGENIFGEWLSRFYQSDFSRLFPSFIRPNRAGMVTAILLFVVALFLVLRNNFQMRPPSHFAIAIVAMIVAAGFMAGRLPATHVDFEDAHVVHEGGELYPHLWTVARFRFRGGWTLREGDELSFAMREGASKLHYKSPADARIRVDGREIVLRSTAEVWRVARIDVPDVDRVSIVCAAGELTVDRIVHE